MRLRVLGTVEVGDVPVRGARVRRLLALLATRPGEVVAADRLVDVCWPEDPPRHAGPALHSLVARARGVLPELVARPPGYLLDVPPDEVDARLFGDLCGRARGEPDPSAAAALLDRALALWRGGALAEFADDAFARPEIDRLGQLRAAAEDDRVRADLDLGRPDDAVARLGPLIAADPLRERRRELLVQALDRAGRPGDALAAYDDFRRLLADELGLEPGPELRRVQADVLARDRPTARPGPARGRQAARDRDVGSARRTPSPDPAPPRPGGATDRPDPAMPVLRGRAESLARLVAEVPDGGGPVTVVGPGGVGKTSLATHAAARLRDAFADGVVVAELAAVSAAPEVATLVAAAVPASGAPAPGREPREQVVDLLRDRATLLVLDNCEHLAVAVAELVDELRARCPRVAVLATSREPLGVRDERVRPLAPLAEADAVALFSDLASAASPEFAADPETVARICRRLDRLPLALELAAARMRVLSAAELVDRLPTRLAFLRSHSRSAPPRHRTLQAVVDWSYDLLTGPQRETLAALGVFAGDFTLDAADAVAGPVDGDGTDAVLADLVDRSLVTASVAHDGGRETRYVLLETVRAYARDRLDERGGTDDARRRHAAHVTDLVRRTGRLAGPSATAGLDAITAEWDELRAAQAWAAVRDRPLAAALVAGLAVYAEVRMPPELFDWADRLLDGGSDGLGPDVATVYGVAASGARFTGDLGRALDLVERGLTHAAGPDDPRRCHLLYVRAECELFRGEAAACVATAAELERVGLLAGDARVVALARADRALVDAYAGRTADAVAIADELVVRTGTEPLLAPWATYLVGEIRATTDPDAALAPLETSLRQARAVGERYAVGVALVTIASLLARRGDPVTAARAAAETLDHWRGTGNRTHQWVAVRHVVELLVRAGREAAAAELLGGLASRRSGGTVFGGDAVLLDELGHTLEEREEAARRGAARTDDELLDLARDALAELAEHTAVR